MSELRASAITPAEESACPGVDLFGRESVPAPLASLYLVTGFWGFHIAYTLVELRVPEALRERSRCAHEIAHELGVNADMLYRLLRAATMLDLCKELPERSFELTAVGRGLCSGHQASFRDYILFMGRHGTRFWQRLPECIKHGKSAIALETGMKAFDYFSSDSEPGELFNRAMTATANVACEAFVAAYDLSFASTIVDIGGGQGRLLAGVLSRAPSARGILFDLPNVVVDAPSVLSAFGMAGRVEVVGGNFFESVPSGADCYIAKAIIHDWGDDDARRILVNVRRAMAPDARVLLFEAVVGPPNCQSFAKLVDLEVVINADSGRERSLDEFAALLASAGLRLERTIPTGLLTILEARAA